MRRRASSVSCAIVYYFILLSTEGLKFATLVDVTLKSILIILRIVCQTRVGGLYLNLYYLAMYSAVYVIKRKSIPIYQFYLRAGHANAD